MTAYSPKQIVYCYYNFLLFTFLLSSPTVSITDHCSLFTVHCSEWCVVSEVHEFSCTVKIYQGEMTIRLDNLRLIDYSTADCEAIAKLRDRLHKLYLQELEETAVALVDLLAKLDRPYLTPLEEKLLKILETC